LLRRRLMPALLLVLPSAAALSASTGIVQAVEECRLERGWPAPSGSKWLSRIKRDHRRCWFLSSKVVGGHHTQSPRAGPVRSRHFAGATDLGQVQRRDDHLQAASTAIGRTDVALQPRRRRFCKAPRLRFFDCNEPYTFEHAEPTEVLDISIPTTLIRSRMRHPQFIARPRTAEVGAGRVMADILESLSREDPQISDDVAYQWSGRVTDMAGIMFESEYSDLPLGDSAVRTAVFRRCVLFIEESLADQELSPSRIADAVGISLRYLHKIFHASGETVGQFVRRRRLERCHEDLTNVRKRHMTIKEIAFNSGFRSQTHFAETVKSHHGTSPSAARRATDRNNNDRSR
jgi:AraC-like DNA-binding protein